MSVEKACMLMVQWREHCARDKPLEARKLGLWPDLNARRSLLPNIVGYVSSWACLVVAVIKKYEAMREHPSGLVIVFIFFLRSFVLLSHSLSSVSFVPLIASQ